MPTLTGKKEKVKEVGDGREKHPAIKLQKQLKLFVVKFLHENQKYTFADIGGELGVSRQRAQSLYKEAQNTFNWPNLLKCEYCGKKKSLEVVDFEASMGRSSLLLCKECRNG